MSALPISYEQQAARQAARLSLLESRLAQLEAEKRGDPDAPIDFKAAVKILGVSDVHGRRLYYGDPAFAKCFWRHPPKPGAKRITSRLHTTRAAIENYRRSLS